MNGNIRLHGIRSVKTRLHPVLCSDSNDGFLTTDFTFCAGDGSEFTVTVFHNQAGLRIEREVKPSKRGGV